MFSVLFGGLIAALTDLECIFKLGKMRIMNLTSAKVDSTYTGRI